VWASGDLCDIRIAGGSITAGDGENGPRDWSDVDFVAGFAIALALVECSRALSGRGAFVVRRIWTPAPSVALRARQGKGIAEADCEAEHQSERCDTCFHMSLQGRLSLVECLHTQPDVCSRRSS
jgi:hypothetical protein